VPGEHRDQRVVPFTSIVADDEVVVGGGAIVGALVLLLLVAAANVANLLLARTAARQREVAIRAALGASRGRVAAAIAIEAALLAAVAAALGLAGARGALLIFQNAVDDMPYWMRLDLDVPVFLFAVLIAALASVVAGVGPALKVTKGPLVDTLRTGHATLRFGRLSAAITIVEAALAVGLLSGAASFAQSLVGFNYQSYRLPEDRVAIAQLYYPPPDDMARQADARTRQAQWKAFYGRIQQDQRALGERVSALPGVRMVAFSWHFPGADRMNVAFEIEGSGINAGVPTRSALVGEGFFALLGARITAGRDFTRDEVDRNQPVAIVNEPFARKYFGDASPIGRRLRTGRADQDRPWLEIVGVVPDLGLNPGDPSRADGVYVPLATMNVVRIAWLADGDPLALAPAVHEAVRQLPLRPRVQWSYTLATNLAQSASLFRGIGWGFIALGLVALVMTCTAIHAIVAFSLAQRRRELAVRLALGAGGRGIVRALLGRTARQLAAGAILGALLALAINLLIDELPMDVPRAGFWRPAAMMAVIMIAGLTACAGPLRKALALRPLDWLRE
jgi:predicted permease